MKQVAKLVVIDNEDNYLLMQRSDHPTFSNDPDLPGGTVEADESTLDAMLREVVEEAGFSIDKEIVKKVYDGTEYSAHHTHYSLYVAKLTKRPEIIMSWEHSSYSWLDRDEFLNKAKNAKDTYMHMVYDVMSRDNTCDRGMGFDHDYVPPYQIAKDNQKAPNIMKKSWKIRHPFIAYLLAVILLVVLLAIVGIYYVFWSMMNSGHSL